MTLGFASLTCPQCGADISTVVSSSRPGRTELRAVVACDTGHEWLIETTLHSLTGGWERQTDRGFPVRDRKPNWLALVEHRERHGRRDRARA